ncbi:MAG: ABC transporter ATP-binding protein [Cytophagales bacterium]|nr:ABC transporter ATP-binding protein [Cytophagales bacterium]
MIEFKSVSKRYGDNKAAALAVDNISFTVPTGTLTTLLGPSGCGKTTTLRMIAGLESPTGGEIWMASKQGQSESVIENVTHRAAHERNVSLVFQNYALFPHMSVLANVSYGLKMTNVKKADAKARATLALKNVGLVGFDDRLPSELSGGQQQRVALARALVLEPAVLLFDEPLSNLDAQLRRAMREEIRHLQQRLKLTVAYVTHDLVEALAVSDHIVVMDKGAIAQQGTPQEVFEQPKSEYVKNFLGEAALLRDDIDRFLKWQK